MKWVTVLILCFFMSDEIVIFNKDNTLEWRVINDTVMGGESSSSVILNEEKHLLFTGQVSTENNGGFAMVRTMTNVKLNESNKRIVLKLKGDGKQYQLRLKSSENQRYWYVHNFKTNTKEEEIILQLADFYPSYRGRKLNKKNFSDFKIKEMAILIGNKKNEKFSLEIESITIR